MAKKVVMPAVTAPVGKRYRAGQRERAQGAGPREQVEPPQNAGRGKLDLISGCRNAKHTSGELVVEGRAAVRDLEVAGRGGGRDFGGERQRKQWQRRAAAMAAAARRGETAAAARRPSSETTMHAHPCLRHCTQCGSGHMMLMMHAARVPRWHAPVCACGSQPSHGTVQ